VGRISADEQKYVSIRDSTEKTVLVGASKADAIFYGAGGDGLFAGRSGVLLVFEPAGFCHPLINSIYQPRMDTD